MTTLLAAPVCAQDWSVVAIGNPSTQATRAFGDAFHAAAALEDIDGADVYLFRDLDTAETEAVLDTTLGQSHVIVYFAGDVIGTANRPLLKGAGHAASGVDLAAYMGRLSENGTQTLALLVETCAGRASTGALSITPPAGLEVLIATSDADCSGPRLTDALSKTDAGATLQSRLSDVTVAMNTADVIAMAVPEAAPVQTTNDVEVGRAVQDVVSILPLSAQAIAPTAVVTPVSFGTQIAPAGTPQQIQAIPAAVTDNIAALPQQQGLPEPSIIVGFVDQQNEFDQVDPDTPDVNSSELAYDNLEARQSLRASDPELFGNLVETGAFDPPADQIEWAIQTELARMNCYRSGIDGIWGNGSRGSIDRYYQQVGGTPPTREAETSLFRVIISRDDVRCPTPVAAAPRPATTTTASRPTSSATPSRPAPSRPAPAPAPAAPAPSSSGGGGLADVNLGGVFR